MVCEYYRFSLSLGKKKKVINAAGVTTASVASATAVDSFFFFFFLLLSPLPMIFLAFVVGLAASNYQRTRVFFLRQTAAPVDLPRSCKTRCCYSGTCWFYPCAHVPLQLRQFSFEIKPQPCCRCKPSATIYLYELYKSTVQDCKIKSENEEYLQPARLIIVAICNHRVLLLPESWPHACIRFFFSKSQRVQCVSVQWFCSDKSTHIFLPSH